MNETLLIVAVVLLAVIVILQIALFFRKAQTDPSLLQEALRHAEQVGERIELAVRDEIAKNRDEASSAAKQSHEELQNTLRAFANTLNKNFAGLTQTSFSNAKTLREELTTILRGSHEHLVNSIGETAKLHNGQLGVFAERSEKLAESNDQKLDAVRDTVEKQLNALQEGNAAKLDEIRKETTTIAQKMREDASSIVTDCVNSQQRQFASVMEQLKNLTDSNEGRWRELRSLSEGKLPSLPEHNAAYVDETPQPVGEGREP